MKMRKKLNNKGFSLVEVIIAIAIMAILAGALVPQLIQYINQSRRSADVETAQTIATAVNTVLAKEDAYNTAASTYLTGCVSGGTDFQVAVNTILGGGTTNPIPKTGGYADFYIDIAIDKNSYSIYAEASGTSPTKDPDNMLYPNIGNNFDNN